MSATDAALSDERVEPASKEGEPTGPSDDRALPLKPLESALAPLRRVTRWASTDPETRLGGVRFLEVNGARWLKGALELDLPHAVRDQLASLAGQLSGFDEASFEERRERVVTMDQLIRRLDAQLGLPPVAPDDPPATPPARARRAPVAPAAEAKDDSAPAAESPKRGRADRKRRKSRRRERRESPRPAPAAPPAPEPEPPAPWWSGQLDEPLEELDLDEAIVEALAGAGIRTARELLTRPPTGWERVGPIHGAGTEIPEGRVAVGARVGARFTRLSPGAAPLPGVLLRGAGPLRAEWTEPASAARGTDRWLERMRHDQRVVVVGELKDGVLRDPELARDRDAPQVGLASYAIEGLDDRAVRAVIWRLLADGGGVDPLPGEVRARLGLLPLGEALIEVHQGGAAAPRAQARMAFDELVAAQVALSAARFQSGRERGIPLTLQHTLVSRLGGGDALILNDAQQLALEDIKRDLLKPAPMLRVLLGEVGAGKGTVALAAAVMVAETKCQVLFLSPDRTTAEQRFTFAEPLLREAGLVARLVEEAPSRAIRDAVGRGEVHVVFGPLELLGRGLDFRRLGLVVAEERQSWGRTTSAIRQLRAPRPHALILPRTPVGAAVCLTAYSDHDLTVLEQITPATGARPVQIEVVPAESRARAYAQAAEAIEASRQVLVVFPMVQGADALTPREAMRVVRALEEDALQGARVRLYHGATPRDERQRIFDDFRHRRFDVLVATTLVEDGPAVPEASVVVVEQADRVEATRLQRILGFVAHARHDATALLVMGDRSDAAAVERVHALVGPDGSALHDAFVAEQGLQGVVAEGAPPLPRFQWVDLSAPAPDPSAPRRPSDRELLWRAREVVHEAMSADPSLRRGLVAELVREARARFASLWPGEGPEGATWRSPLPDPVPADRKRRRRRRRKR